MTDRPTAGRFEGREHRLPVRVYYEDTDFTGLVYHGNYVRYFERGRSDALRLMGIGHAELLDGDQPMAFVVSKMSLTFLKPARIDEELVVRTRYDAIKGPRLLISQTIARGADDLCTADVEVVCIHLDGRPRRPTKGLVEKVGPWLTGEP
ncbi:MAG: YbgC/FadM family acyl-CoA thioesterase [Brevundimonas sp.]|uniref:YbgC/FadM family acyl-CoA thioesterase n=1 Tax=Brevundimonas sp. TaxID=1871086 RepID=UPI002613CC44|nr:YbgC/FadM family acyl-CoA thioesterase [Brevundimonas sp.]MDI6626022.1 YbgC/FadM family acyl-CoA thioesterase [Brevundimonas sp.]MDQ7812078.1 YbgC/FadM family acyl-CoA thioesterase [Brevundimonas sp.]